VIITDQGTSGGFGCLLKLQDTFIKKGYFHILSQSFLNWLQSYNKLQIRPSKKIVSKKFDIGIKKMQTFLLSSIMKT